MSLENELKHFKDELKAEEQKLAKFESLDITTMTHEQIEARNRGIKMVKQDIQEIKEIITEIQEEMEA